MAKKDPRNRWKHLTTGLAIGALAGLLATDLKLQSIVSIWGDKVPLVVATALIGAGLWMSRWRSIFGGATACLGALWLAVAFTPLCEWLARDLARQDTVEAADAVYVLGSDMQMDGELTTEAMSRLLHGLELMGNDLAPRLVLPELSPPKPSFAEAARKVMYNLGMTREVFSIGPVVRTRDEAVALGALFREHGWRRVLVVTSPPHSRRASAALEKEGLAVVSSPSTQTQFDLETLDQAGDRIKAFPSLVHERVGLWFYKRRGWVED